MNLPPGEYAVGLHVRERDAMRYAIEGPQVIRVMVVGPVTGGGVAHVDPQVRVEDLSRLTLSAEVVTAAP